MLSAFLNRHGLVEFRVKHFTVRVNLFQAELRNRINESFVRQFYTFQQRFDRFNFTIGGLNRTLKVINHWQ
ncbi:Uncharacterised protein [Vibrio cholerae]|nr:Uncharacterised protein [Vibrio cholerae]CSD22472.1 Uncharacterised protein [Vibrio cholerae]